LAQKGKPQNKNLEIEIFTEKLRGTKRALSWGNCSFNTLPLDAMNLGVNEGTKRQRNLPRLGKKEQSVSDHIQSEGDFGMGPGCIEKAGSWTAVIVSSLGEK